MTPLPLTRRHVLAGGAAALGGWLAGCRRRADAPGDLDEPFDVCIVGSGFAGTLLGLALVEAGLRTCIVEVGGGAGDAAEHPSDHLRCSTSGADGYPGDRARFLGPGGTSAVWTGVLSRLLPTDFRERSEFGLDVDWPLAFEELDPWYCSAEAALSATGFPPTADEPPRSCPYPNQVDEPFERSNLFATERERSFFSLTYALRPDKRTVRLVDEEVPRFAAHRHATLLSGHQVTRLVSADGRRIDHALARAGDGSSREIRARVFVNAAGVLESARLLLLSRSSAHPKGLGNAHDQVGRYFNNHPTWLSIFEPEDRSAFPLGIQRCYAFNDGYRREGLSACHVQVHAFEAGAVQLKLQPEVEPRVENRLTLSEGDRDLFGDPQPHLQFAYSERDLRTLERVQGVAARELGGLGVPSDAVVQARRLRFHPAGVCRMAATAKEGVVNSDLQVFGVDNLYVSGAAVFPTSGTGNPTLTVVALTLRLAQHLRDRLGA